MSSTSEQRKPLFSADREDAIMAQVVGRPSGVVVDLGGFAIDLVAIPFAKENRIMNIYQSFSAMFEGVKDKPVADAMSDASALLTQRFGELKALLKEVVRDSVELGDDGERVFDAWYEQLPMGPTIRTLLSKMLEANGLGELGNVLGTVLQKALLAATQAMGTGAERRSLSVVPES